MFSRWRGCSKLQDGQMDHRSQERQTERLTESTQEMEMPPERWGLMIPLKYLNMHELKCEMVCSSAHCQRTNCYKSIHFCLAFCWRAKIMSFNIYIFVFDVFILSFMQFFVTGNRISPAANWKKAMLSSGVITGCCFWKGPVVSIFLKCFSKDLAEQTCRCSGKQHLFPQYSDGWLSTEDPCKQRKLLFLTLQSSEHSVVGLCCLNLDICSTDISSWARHTESFYSPWREIGNNLSYSTANVKSAI